MQPVVEPKKVAPKKAAPKKVDTFKAMAGKKKFSFKGKGGKLSFKKFAKGLGKMSLKLKLANAKAAKAGKLAPVVTKPKV